MKTAFDYNKEQYRGTLKQIMKVNGLRTISIANYFKWLNEKYGYAYETPIHSLKLDLQDGYINAYGWKNGKCGEKIVDLSTSGYEFALSVVKNILDDESKIPYNIKRNIFVKMCR